MRYYFIYKENKMMRFISISFFLIILTTQLNFACTCIDNADFCGSIANNPPDLIVKGVAIANNGHGVKFAILDHLIGVETPDTINVWGDTGILCRHYVSASADTLILALHYVDYMGNTIGLSGTVNSERAGDFMLSVCGTFKLFYENGIVKAPSGRKLTYGSQALQYPIFKDVLQGPRCKPPVVLSLKAVLEGAYKTTTDIMHTNLKDGGLLPEISPYDQTPWNYLSQQEKVIDMPYNTVDWVYVKLLDKNDPNIVVDEAVGLLQDNGLIYGVDDKRNNWNANYNWTYLDDIVDSRGLRFYNANPNEEYYIVLLHRNHVGVVSKDPVSLVRFPQVGATQHTDYDFTIGLNTVMGNNQMREMQNGEYALLAGDANNDGRITIHDMNIFYLGASQINGYYAPDFNLEGNVTIHDFNLYIKNAGTIGASPVIY